MTGWSAASSVFVGVAPPGTGKVRWVALARRSGSDEVVLTYSDFTQIGQWRAYTVTWDGAKFQKAEAITGAAGLGRDTQAFDAAYEDKSGDLMIFASHSCCMCFGAGVRLAGTTAFNGPSNDACGFWSFVRLVPQRGGDGIVLVGDEGDVAIWSGAFFYPTWGYWPGPTHSGITAWADAAWVGSQPVAIAVQRGWPDEPPPGGVGSILWTRSSTGGTWTQPLPVAVPGMKDVTRVQLEAFPAEDRVIAALADSAKSLWVATYDLSGWVVTNSKAPVVKNQLATPDTRVFSIAIKQ
jgi:hypothetical protein